MTKVLIEMFGAFIAGIGFSIIYNTRGKRLIWCGLNGALAWGACCAAAVFTDSIFVQYMIAAAAGTLFSEIVARLTKAPATIYLIPGLLPMVPGGSLYYTTYALVTSNEADAAFFGKQTAVCAFGLAVGLVIISVGMYYINEVLLRKHQREHS
ncbi:MAG: threonine/serine exporter family protein [Lachnospiraceae bacterium]|nr:threonine/serine exporter family protein [Lachnospiraceae bacterium]